MLPWWREPVSEQTRQPLRNEVTYQPFGNLGRARAVFVQIRVLRHVCPSSHSTKLGAFAAHRAPHGNDVDLSSVVVDTEERVVRRAL